MARQPFEPTQFGRYLLTDRIATGGMAEIFQAKVFGAMGFEKNLVIKRILPQYAGDREFVRMFATEAKLVCNLEHPNIVQVHELGEVEGIFYIAMEFVNGLDGRVIWRTLAKRDQRLPIPLACYITSEFLKGLEYAHHAIGPDGKPLGVVHRDVSPSNIMVSFLGNVKIGDFGIALIKQESKSQAGALKGKFGYMTPEQLAGMPVDRRSDLFSSGVVLAELMMGRRLFRGKSDFETMNKVMNVRLDVLEQHAGAFPAEVVAILRRALQRSPDHRYPSAGDFQDDIAAYLDTVGVRITPKTLAAFIAEFVVPHVDMSKQAGTPPQEETSHSSPPRPEEITGSGGGGDSNVTPTPSDEHRAPAPGAELDEEMDTRTDTLDGPILPEVATDEMPRAPEDTVVPPPPEVDPEPRGVERPVEQVRVPSATPPRGLARPDTIDYVPRDEISIQDPAADAASCQPRWSSPTQDDGAGTPGDGTGTSGDAAAPAGDAASHPADGPDQRRLTIASGEGGRATAPADTTSQGFEAPHFGEREFEFQSSGAYPEIELDMEAKAAFVPEDQEPKPRVVDISAPVDTGTDEDTDSDEGAKEPARKRIVTSPDAASVLVSEILGSAREDEPDAPPAFEGQLGARTVAKVLFRLCVAGESGLVVLSGPGASGRQGEFLDWLLQAQSILRTASDHGADGGRTVQLYLDEGTPALASADRSEETLTAYLMRVGVVSPQAVEQALRAWPHLKPVAALLADSAIVPLQVSRHVSSFVLWCLFTSFGWDCGHFAFYRGHDSPQDAFMTGKDICELVSRGVSYIDEPSLDTYLQRLAGYHLGVEPRPSIPLEQFTTDRLTRRVFQQLFEPRPVEAVVEACLPLGDPVRIKQALYLLVECELAALV